MIRDHFLRTMCWIQYDHSSMSFDFDEGVGEATGLDIDLPNLPLVNGCVGGQTLWHWLSDQYSESNSIGIDCQGGPQKLGRGVAY